MNVFELNEGIYQAIVDGTLKGYLDYLDERKAKKKEMLVSGAYAWTKGNHIDDQVAKIGQSAGIDFTVEKASYTWEYLQFTLNEKADTFMLIVKNSRRIRQTFDGVIKKEKNYLTDLADLNLPAFKETGLTLLEKTEQIELELNYPEEIKAIQEGRSLAVEHACSRFYIVTYEINDDTKIIDSIHLMMPNSVTMSLVSIKDLSTYMASSPYEITYEDVAIIKEEKTTDQTIFSGEPNAFGLSVAVEIAEKEN